jgi:hypothetical protein
MKKATNSRYILQMILHCKKMNGTHNNSGYALLITSIMAILTFSMLSVFVFSSNLYKSVANNILESGSTFYAAETALNTRAYEVREKFVDYERPNGTSPIRTDVVRPNTIADQMSVCMGLAPGTTGTDDFACNSRTTDYTASVIEYDNDGNLTDRVKGQKDISGNLVNTKDSKNDIRNTQYRTYSFVKDVTQYAPAPAPPNTVNLARITDGNFAGLNAQEYVYRVYTTAAKERDMGSGTNKELSSQTMLQMDFKSRLVPIFQFAAFYQGNLEITSSSNMTLNGPVHTNSNLHMAPGGTLTLDGSVTAAGRIYKAVEFTATHGGTPSGAPARAINIVGGSGTNLSANLAWTHGTVGSPANESASRITTTELTNNKNILKENQPVLNLPTAGLLGRTGGNAEYHNLSDVRVYFDPLNVNPFKKVQAVRALSVDLIEPMIRSLLQPVLAVPQIHGAETTPISEVTRLCPKGDRTAGEPTSIVNATPSVAAGMNSTQITALKANTAIAIADRPKVIAALQKAMMMTDSTLANPTPLTSFSATASPATGNLKTNLQNSLSQPTYAGIATATLVNTNLNVLADAVGGCYLPAPMQVLQGANYPERREGGRQMNILQSNIKSLTVWNRDGVYTIGAGNPISTANRLFARKPETAIPAGAVAKAVTACDYECMGLAANDQSNGGMVWHFSIDKDDKPTYDYPSGTGANRAGQSPYGFAFSGGSRLPGALTLASDQAIYVQGDFNNPSNVIGDLDTALDNSQFTVTQPGREKKPISFLGDTISVLSNRCLDADQKLNCFRLPGGINSGTIFPIASTTVVRAAFLGRTDRSVVNGAGTLQENSGGLNNYMRMMENWSTLGATFKYRGSFVSLGIPQEFSGLYRWGNNGLNGSGNADANALNPTMTTGVVYNIPTRDFGFETDFNTQEGLPPLTPRAVVLKQKVFKRDYDRSDRNRTT